MPKTRHLAYNCTNRTIEFHVIGGACLRLLPRQAIVIPAALLGSSALRRLQHDQAVTVFDDADRARAEKAATDERERRARSATDEAKRRLEAVKKATAEREALAKKLATERKAEEKRIAEEEQVRAKAIAAATKRAAARKKASKRSRSKNRRAARKTTKKKGAAVSAIPLSAEPDTPVADPTPERVDAAPSTERELPDPNPEDAT